MKIRYDDTTSPGDLGYDDAEVKLICANGHSWITVEWKDRWGTWHYHPEDSGVCAICDQEGNRD